MKMKAAEVLANFTEAYEEVSRGKLVEIAKAHNYPLEVLFTLLQSYKWNRSLVYGKLTSKEMHPTTCTLAGALAPPV